MVDVLGNVINTGDIVLCALGANRNRNNSTLFPCEVVDVKENRCLIKHADNVHSLVKSDIRIFQWSAYVAGYPNHAWKRSHQIVKADKYLNTI